MTKNEQLHYVYNLLDCDKRAISQTVFMVLIAINSVEHVTVTLIIKCNYKL